MSKIQFEQISEEELLVTIPPETPIQLVNQLTKSLLSKGLVEYSEASTLTERYFFRPQDNANQLADKLIKSLEGMTKASEHTKFLWEAQAQQRLVDRNKRRSDMGLAPITMEQMKNPGAVKPPVQSTPEAPPAPAAPVAPGPTAPNQTAGPVSLTGSNKLLGAHDIGVNVKKGDDCEDCGKADCESCMSKSNYGPKGASQYTLADNIRRKANNTGDKTGFGANVNTKQYTSAKFAGKDMQSSPAQKRPSKPIKWTPEQIEAENKKRGLKKSWGEHLPFPSAEEEILRLAKATVEDGETAAANQLANLMVGKQMLGKDVHPVVAAMMAPPPPQPTNEQLFGHLVVSEEMAKKAEQQWSGTLNNWLVEASKPISQRFSSEEEEMAYWSKIKVEDRDDGKSGY